jgi:leucyl-tRNA synthetase
MSDIKQAGIWASPAWEEAVDIYLRMLAPIAPHIAEELWYLLGKNYSVHQQPWPQIDEAATKEDEIILVVQVNGKVRDRLSVPVNISEEDAKAKALESLIVQKILAGQAPQKVIFVPGRLVNIVK